MIPAIEREVVEKREWMTEEEMSSALALAGSAPGGIGVNAAAFIGYRLSGVPGAVTAVLGITLPTFSIILALCVAFAQFQENPIIAAAFEGVHGAIIALILVAAYKMGKTAISDRYSLMFMLITVLVMIDFTVHPLILIAGGLGGGVLFIRFREWIGRPIALPDESSAGFENIFGDGI
ncbi:chromate transporter [Paenibacillus sp. TRM 82003]|nr:chromate transporter [Paenibacillus sp. TRM 82003]MCI3923461.1 chromate transporter [Paenibacillus sp. TRM 82003]